MKASELRIGNWILPSQIKWPNLPPFQVKVIELENKEIGEPTANEHALSDELDPIPLTEEWLVKFGLIYTGGFEDRYVNDALKIYGNPFKAGYTVENIEPEVNIHYVHQLQNLYFALTGTDLTIKE